MLCVTLEPMLCQLGGWGRPSAISSVMLIFTEAAAAGRKCPVAGARPLKSMVIRDARYLPRGKGWLMSAEGPTGSAALAVLRLILERGELIAVRLGEPAVAGRHVQRLGHLMSAIEALTGSSQRGPGGLLAAQLPAVAAEPGREQAREGWPDHRARSSRSKCVVSRVHAAGLLV
jgi:hypothetical protein